VRRGIAKLAAKIFLASSLVAVAAHAEGEKIVASFHSMAEPFFVEMAKQARLEAKRLGIRLVIVDGQSSSPEQTANIEIAVTQEVAGIVMAPQDASALAYAADEAIADNIPLITVDRSLIGTSKPVPHVGADNVAGGRMMAELAGKTFPDGANIVLLLGMPGSSSADDRARGMHEVIARLGPKYRIVAEQPANWARDQGFTVTQNILTALAGHPPDIILAANDDMALGALEAISQAGLRNAGIKVVGFDATPDALARVKNGEMLATVEQDPGRQIRTALGELVANIRNKTPMHTIAIKPILILRDNLDDAARIGEVR
jgi:inositol transport system substrate-binding protein